MNALVERVRTSWEALNERERRMFAVLGAVFALFLLGFPLFWTARQNAEIEDNNEQLRAVLALIAEERPRLQQLADARRTASARYANRTPPLASYLGST
jgi:type II secretory pathway component PulM